MPAIESFAWSRACLAFCQLEVSCSTHFAHSAGGDAESNPHHHAGLHAQIRENLGYYKIGKPLQG